MNNEHEHYKEIEADMMRLTEVDPEIGYHRCRLYSDVLINPWTGTVKSIKSGRVFDDKFRNKMVKWLVWNHCSLAHPYSQTITFSPKTETKATTPSLT
jgi:hypothetical protein